MPLISRFMTVRDSPRCGLFYHAHYARQVLLVGEHANRGDARRARAQDAARVRFVDSADGDERERRERVRRLSQTFDAEGRAVGALRGRVEDGAEDCEVRAAVSRVARLVGRVRGDAYQKIFAEGASDDP